MMMLGRSLTPRSDDPRWPEWVRPVLAVLRAGGEVPLALLERFGAAHDADKAKTENLLSWALNERLAVARPTARYAITAYGLAWLGEYALPPSAVRFAEPLRRWQGPSSRVDSTVLEEGPYGLLTALRLDGFDRWRNRMVACRCACGREARVRAADLRSGHSTSCSSPAHRAGSRRGRAGQFLPTTEAA